MDLFRRPPPDPLALELDRLLRQYVITAHRHRIAGPDGMPLNQHTAAGVAHCSRSVVAQVEAGRESDGPLARRVLAVSDLSPETLVPIVNLARERAERIARAAIPTMRLDEKWVQNFEAVAGHGAFVVLALLAAESVVGEAAAQKARRASPFGQQKRP